MLKSLNVESKHNVIAYPYFHRHLGLFWDYFIVNGRSSTTSSRPRVHGQRLQHLLSLHFNTVIETIYVAMHQNEQMDSGHRFRGFVLKMLCTLYLWFSCDGRWHYKLEGKDQIMGFVVADYFKLTQKHCDHHQLHSTERAVARFMAHSFNFAYFMRKMADHITGADTDGHSDVDTNRMVLTAQNMYRLLLPFEMATEFEESSFQDSYHKKANLERCLWDLLCRIWPQAQIAMLSQLHNRFQYLSDGGNVDVKLGRFTCGDGRRCSGFELVAVHLVDWALRRRLVTFFQFNRRWMFQRSYRDTFLFLEVLRVLKAVRMEEASSSKGDNHDGADRAEEANVAVSVIETAIGKLCAHDRSQGLCGEEMETLRSELVRLKMSMVGPLPMEVMDDIVSHWRRRLLWDSDLYPLDVHMLILSYCQWMQCDAEMDSVEEGQIVMLDVASLLRTEELIVDREYVNKGRWMVCRVKEVLCGPMQNVTMLLVQYRIGNTNYGHLWRAVERVEWVEQSGRWRHNVILKKSGHGIEDNPLEAALFESWWECYVRKWAVDERIYLLQSEGNKSDNVGTKQTESVQSTGLYRQGYLTVNTRRDYRKQRRRR